jgi:N-acetylmuramoyl-L-alanine amidase
MLKHVVKKGECLASIAAQHGFEWKTIWELPDNKALRDKRPNPNIIFQGDVVCIPEKKLHEEKISTGQKHKFQATATHCQFRLRLMVNDKPLDNTTWTLTLASDHAELKSDGDGWIEQKIAPNAGKGSLQLQNSQVTFALEFGRLDPIDQVQGVQQRLSNMGFFRGACDGKQNDHLALAIAAFEKYARLPVTGKLCAALREKLVKMHGS